MFPLIVLHGSGRSDCLPKWAIPYEAAMNEIGRGSPQWFALHRALSRTSVNDQQIVTRFFDECDAHATLSVATASALLADGRWRVGTQRGPGRLD
jgi:hypothetical protein